MASSDHDNTTSFSVPGVSDRTIEARCFLVLVLQSYRPLLSSARICLSALDRVRIGRGTERAFDQAGKELSVQVADTSMSACHAELVRMFDQWVLEDRGSKNGVIVNGHKVEKAVLEDGDIVELGSTFFLFQERVGGPLECAIVQESRDLAPSLTQWRTLQDPLAQEFRLLENIARADVPVLISGETGTGKEVLARGVHRLSGRRGPFVAVNCGGLPHNLLESELFGYRKGAFSGATEDRPGLIRSADTGTLFLDEVGDLPLPSQAALLRVLQDHHVLPLGATQPVAVDFRLLAATNRDLQAQVRRGEFRADLLARLSGHVVQLPPLRSRREDLGLLIRDLLLRIAGNAAEQVEFHRDVTRRLLAYSWPFNVRELENCLKAAVAVAPNRRILLEHLPKAITSPMSAPIDPAGRGEEVLLGADAHRRQELAMLLEKHHGNVSAVAREMGKARPQVQRWIKKYGLKRVSTFKPEKPR